MLKNHRIWPALAAGLVLLAAALSFPGFFGFTKSARVEGIRGGDGFALAAELPRGIAKERKRAFLFPDPPVLQEGGEALGRPGASPKETANAGRGRYQVSGNKIVFSTSDGLPPGGREYSVRAPLWSLGETFLLAAWAAALAACAIALRLSVPDGLLERMRGPRAARAGLGISLAAAVAAFVFAPAVADGFFLGLAIPALWALAVGVLSVQTGLAGRAGLAVMSAVPAIAGFFYYALNAASGGSFVVAGRIPCSDAWLHFLQSAEIALHGTTGVVFNGRFLYPAFYAVLLDVTGLNLLAANLVVSLLVMLGFAFACRLVAKRAGFAGAAAFGFLFWLYFRVHGCGLVMTENLGLLLGTAGLAFLLLSVDRRKLWPVYAAILFFGLGSVARPGALFILPALALYAGVRVWGAANPATETTKRFPPKNAASLVQFVAGLKKSLQPAKLAAPAVAVAAGLALVGACFAANSLAMKSLSDGEGKAFGNFAFTLYGLLNGTNWSAGADAYGWDSSLVMDRNIKQIKESPLSLVRGIFRAYSETLKTGFLFRFGPEKRLASTGMAMLALAVFGCWIWKPLRGDACWIILLAVAIFASIPFAPPWDAGLRPYAASVPVQVFLAAAGFSMVLDLFRRFAEMAVSGERAGFLREAPDGEEHASNPPERSRANRPVSAGRLAPVYAAFRDAPGLIVFAGVCLFLVIPAPLLLKLASARRAAPGGIPALVPGSWLIVSAEDNLGIGRTARANYLDRLSEFRVAHPDEAKFFSSQPGDFVLAIDWKDLRAVLLPPGGGAGGAATKK